MRNRFLRLMFCGGIGLLLANFLPAEQVPSGSDATQATYLQRMQELRQSRETARAGVLARYRKALDQLRQAFIKKGDLDTVQAVDEEIARVERLNLLPAVLPPNANAELVRVARVNRDLLEKAELETAAQVVEWTDKYLAVLEIRKKEALRSDKLDMAKVYEADRKDVRQTPEYEEAKFLLAEKESVTAPPSVPPPAENIRPLPGVPPARLVEKVALCVDPDGLYDAQHLAEGFPTLQSGSGAGAYKLLTVVDTGKASIPGGVGMQLEGIIDGDNGRCQLRCRLRSRTSEGCFTNLKVLVQYFAKNPNVSVGLLETRAQLAMIPLLGPKGITCEMKPAELPFSYVYHNKNGLSVEDREGVFVGAAVSVFSSDDKLLGQAVSNPPLKDHCKTAFAIPSAWVNHEVRGAPQQNSPLAW